MTTLSRFQLPPCSLLASQMICGGPPAMSFFLSLPPAEYTMNLLSKDQNGGAEMGPTSEPSSGLTSSELSDRIHIRPTPSGPTEGKASQRPSGDNVAAVPGLN